MIPQNDSRRLMKGDIDYRPIPFHLVPSEARYDGTSHYSVTYPVRKCGVFARSSQNSCEKYTLNKHVKKCF